MTETTFGSVRMFTLKNSNGVEVDILNYGGYVRSFRVPDKNGKIVDIVLGFDNLAGWCYYCIVNHIIQPIYTTIDT